LQAGLDSLGAVELRDAIERGFGVSLPATAAFDYPTVSRLAAFISHMQLPGRPAQSGIRNLQANNALGPTASATVLPRLRAMLADILGMPVTDDQPLVEVGTPDVSTVLQETYHLHSVGVHVRWCTHFTTKRSLCAADTRAVTGRRAWTPWALWNCTAP